MYMSQLSLDPACKDGSLLQRVSPLGRLQVSGGETSFEIHAVFLSSKFTMLLAYLKGVSIPTATEVR